MTVESKSTPETPSGEYEFNSPQHAAIRRLARVMRVAAAAWFVFGLVSAVTAFLIHARGATLAGQHASAVLGLVLNTAMGIFTLGAASPFARAVRTEGHDIENTMEALIRLNRLFRWLRIVVIAALVLGVVAFFYSVRFMGRLPGLGG